MGLYLPALDRRRALARRGGTNATAQAYFDRVVSEGGTLSAAAQGYANTLLAGMESDGLLSLVDDMGLILGDDLASARVKALVGTGANNSASNTGYVGGDYSEAAGLSGDSASKYLSSDFDADNLSATDFHIAFYVCDMPVLDNTAMIGGIYASSTSVLDIILYPSGGDMRIVGYAGSLAVIYDAPDTETYHEGLFLLTRRPGGDLELYHNGVLVASQAAAASGTFPALPLRINDSDHGGLGAVDSDKSMGFWSFGSGFTAAQASDQYDRVNALQTSLGRQSAT